jgi:type IV pilus assembly protein PilA
MKNNKGFSLVELIIVIAIMAVLVGVMAPQYIKYVEKSRISTDNDNASEILGCVKTALSDDEVVSKLSSTTYYVSWDKGGTIEASQSDLLSVTTDTLGDSSVTRKSTKYKESTYVITIKYNDAFYATGEWK